MVENEITEKIIGAAMKIHQRLGPGLLESAYQACLFYDIMKEGLIVEKEKPLPLVYEEVKLDCGYKIDLLVDNTIIAVRRAVEVKSVHTLADIHLAQIFTYLKLSNKHIGLLINFNVTRLKNGLKRVINKYYQPL